MYNRYFGLKEAPFSIAVNPRYLYMSTHHRDALAHLLYGVGEGGGFVLLTGEVGTGKTTIIRSLLQQLPENTDIAMVFNPALNAEELLATVCDELGASYVQDQFSLKTLTDSLHQFLLTNHARGRNTVLLIDEAQHLQFDVLEQIRLLTNLETNTQKLLQIILVGQPELRTLLNRPELRQLAQRITARYQLKPLSLQETDDYIRHRLQVAGLPASQTLFPKPVVSAIFRASGGVPRIINVLCDRMLLGTYGQNKTIVDRAMLKQAVKEVIDGGEPLSLSSSPYRQPLLAAAATAVVLALGVWVWQPPRHSPAPVAPAVEAAPASNPAVVEAPLPPVPAAVIPPSPPEIIWHSHERDAAAELLQVLGFDTNTFAACETPSSGKQRCERVTITSWQELKTYNRPAVLKLITHAKMQRYAVLLGFDEDYAFVRVNGEILSVPILGLGEQWTGDTLFFWQTSEFFQAPVALNDRGPFIQWLAKQFATLDQQATTLTVDRFNKALQKRVMLFQQQHQLNADGVVGMQTLLKLDEALASPVTLISALPRVVSHHTATDGGEG